MSGSRVLILGYGNPGREDDGLGPALAERCGALGLPGVTVDSDYQLNIEHAADLSGYDAVIFADASVDAREPFSFGPTKAAETIAFTTHSVSPEAVLAICQDSFGPPPEAWVLAIRGYSFEFAEGLTDKARENLDRAVAFVKSKITSRKEQQMGSCSASKKTILIIDDDPDIRAAVRIILEAEGYSVGEAAGGEEGLKVAEKIKPDAIIIDLMMEEVDTGAQVARKLKDEEFAGPIWMLSAAGDTVQYNLDQRELGLAGIFQKPVDPARLVKTLKSKLAGG
ncbi:MAG TPA: hydrogenase maturation protease [Candidatus Brocadiia bacterium]|nr:hydrogenase maturation protease [Candidatus Brocadiia bacterium]